VFEAREVANFGTQCTASYVARESETTSYQSLNQQNLYSASYTVRNGGIYQL